MYQSLVFGNRKQLRSSVVECEEKKGVARGVLSLAAVPNSLDFSLAGGQQGQTLGLHHGECSENP